MMTEALRNIENKLARLRSAKRNYYLFSGAVFTLLVFTAGILVFSVIDLFASTADSLRLMLFSAIVFLSIFLLAHLGIAPVVKRLRQLLLALRLLHRAFSGNVRASCRRRLCRMRM